MSQVIDLPNGAYEALWLLQTEAGQGMLAACYRDGLRPKCRCVEEGLEMYIARRGLRYYLARMPCTGFLHNERCPSFENMVELFSGAYAYARKAVQEMADSSLVLATRLWPEAAVGKAAPEPGSFVSLGGLLDYLIEQGNINRLSPLDRPRPWRFVRMKLIEAARWIRLGKRQTPLSDILFLPETYSREAETDSYSDCVAFLNTHQPALLCAPVKEIKKAEFGKRIVLKHLPRLRLWLSGKLDARLPCNVSRFGAAAQHALALVLARPGRVSGNYTALNLAYMTTDTNFLPCGSLAEADAAVQLLEEGLSLVRPLRFDCAKDVPLADFAVFIKGGLKIEPVFVLAPTGNALLDQAKQSLASLMVRHHAKARLFFADAMPRRSIH